MELFTKSQIEQLNANSRDYSPVKDHAPVVKLFMTGTACTWLLSELDPDDQDIAYGLCDLGFGCPEIGYVSISEIKEAQSPGHLRFLERDTSFVGNYPLSVYARAANQAGQIVTNEAMLLRSFANRKLQP